MKRIIINMQNYVFTDAVSWALKQNCDSLDAKEVEHPAEIPEMCDYIRPYAVMMEVASFSPYTIEERIAMREKIIAGHPECKIVFVCDEKADFKVAERVKQAKKDGLIDQFIYDSVSATYLSALMDAL